jgi:hypothetical protein
VGRGVSGPRIAHVVSAYGIARDVISGGRVAAGLGPYPELLRFDASAGVHVRVEGGPGGR